MLPAKSQQATCLPAHVPVHVVKNGRPAPRPDTTAGISKVRASLGIAIWTIAGLGILGCGLSVLADNPTKLAEILKGLTGLTFFYVGARCAEAFVARIEALTHAYQRELDD
jgi:hypothetical protein